MKNLKVISRFIILIPLLIVFSCNGKADIKTSDYFIYEVYLASCTLQMFWKSEKGDSIFHSFGNLASYLSKIKNQKLIFAMNGGMFHKDFTPVGLYINDENIITPIDTSSGKGNFYLKPNGIFGIDKSGRALVITTEKYLAQIPVLNCATQSGPMLLIEGHIHPEFNPTSTNKNIRNGVGILPSGNPVFVISELPVTFYEFANFFKDMGCRDALYLDGYISKVYFPSEQYLSKDEKFAVIIAVTKPL